MPERRVGLERNHAAPAVTGAANVTLSPCRRAWQSVGDDQAALAITGP
jgi:hypothetical protein